jgi:hypothetical protein
MNYIFTLITTALLGLSPSAPPSNVPIPEAAQVVPVVVISPTPGLKPESQALSDRMMTEAAYVGSETVGKEKYTVRAAGQVIILYNSLDHVLAICSMPSVKFAFRLSYAPDGFLEGTEPLADFPMDGKLYSVKVFQEGSDISFALCDATGRPFFSVLGFKGAISPAPKGYRDYRKPSGGIQPF